MFNGFSVLVTGGTGSFGKKFVATILKNYPDVKRLVIFSRDELKQYEMAQEFSPKEFPQLRYFIGDVRDKDRLLKAMREIDFVVHAAALKHVPIAEYNPFECIKTNVLGAQNVIDACLETSVKKVVALSTDKAAAPINLYGATKLCADKLFVAANNMKGKRDIKFSAVRYGNVFCSRGSVVPFFLKKKREGGVLPITDERMTRFSISLEDGVKLVLNAFKMMWGGEVFVPKIPSYKIMDIAKAVAPECDIEYVGIRPGEKIHEEMITTTDSLNTIEFDDYYVIVPSMPSWKVDDYAKAFGGKMFKEGVGYNSGDNEQWLTVEELKQLVSTHFPVS